MKTLPYVAAAVLLSACASGGPPSDTVPAGPVSWPVGQYRLEGTVQYSQDTSFATSTARRTYWADLTVAPESRMSISSETGICRDPPLTQVREDQERGRRSFECGEVLYTLRSTGRTIAGELTASVIEDRRVQGACVRYENDASGNRTCVEYGWLVQSTPTQKSARLRVLDGF